MEHEFEDEEVGVQDDGFPILSVDKPGWWWVMHTCNEISKLEISVTENQCKERMEITGFGYPGGPDRAANLELPVTSYFGGWKMKVQLCAAQLVNWDELMLSNETMKFAFPEPGPLEGLKSRSKVVLRMTCVDFQYIRRTGPRLWT